MHLAKSLKLNNNTVFVANIVPRDDAYKRKVDEVNVKLEKLCSVNDIEIISHKRGNPKRHLNRDRLHFNDCEVSAFVRYSSVFFEQF